MRCIESSRLAAACLLSLGAAAAWPQACEQPDALKLRATVTADQVQRANAPRELFGFNVPWRDFQMGYLQGDGEVRSELIELLKPFKGALYRYPGGTPSNWFDWGDATRGPREKRIALHADYERYAKADFGPDEFARFVQAVDGRAILTLNLMGPYKKPLPATGLKGPSRQFAEVVKSTPGFGCAGGKGCRVMALELGNELDWEPYKIGAAEYVQRAEAARAEVNDVLPDAVWVAHGRSAPWGLAAEDTAAFNKELARALAPRVQGFAIHPYYDGIDVPSAIGYVRSFGDTWKAVRPDAQVYVTEHARWPAEPPKGSKAKWQDNWYQASGLGGAISTADFMLALMPMTYVAAANWHALATQGPWQLVRRDTGSNRLFASPIYWGMRVLRDAYLDDVVKLEYQPTKAARYGGGYDQRLVAMRGADGRVSVLGINRAQQPMALDIDWAGAKRRASGRAQLRFITAENTSIDNDAAQPRKVEMQTQAASVAADRKRSSWCVPPRSVFSIVEP
jgi:alpha-N-arabinofuranosidase